MPGTVPPSTAKPAWVTMRQLFLHAINHLRHHLLSVAEKRAAMTTP
jgi:predicted metal-dependent hydrolase